MSRSVLLQAILALVLTASPAAGVDWLGDASRPVEWKKPVAYTASGLAVQWVVLVASGEADDSPSLDNFRDAWSDVPRRDDDSIAYNFVLHPLWGSETYLRAREGNMGVAGSFGFSLGASAVWEYLFESWTEHPSSQDLVFTTGIGWMIGELRYRVKQRLADERHWLVDPIHEALEHFGVVVGDDQRPRVVYSRVF